MFYSNLPIKSMTESYSTEKNEQQKAQKVSVRVILTDTGNQLQNEYIGCGTENAT